MLCFYLSSETKKDAGNSCERLVQIKKKAPNANCVSRLSTGRGDRTRTCGILVPKKSGVPVSAYFRAFPPLSAQKTALFGAPQFTVSECSETVGGLLCGQQQFLQNNTRYTLLVITREAIFYTVIITPTST